MARRRQRPDDQGHSIADFRAEAVDQPAEEQESERVSEREGSVDVAILSIGPAHFPLEVGGEHAQDAPIDVVDRRGAEEQGTDDPAVPADGPLR